jgi:hypothetical protein
MGGSGHLNPTVLRHFLFPGGDLRLTSWIGGYVGPRAGLEAFEKAQLSCFFWELNVDSSVFHSVASSLHLPMYKNSISFHILQNIKEHSTYNYIGFHNSMSHIENVGAILLTYVLGRYWFETKRAASYPVCCQRTVAYFTGDTTLHSHSASLEMVPTVFVIKYVHRDNP